MKKLIALILLALIVPVGAMGQTHPSADMLKALPVEVYEAAKVAEKVATQTDAAHAKALADMKKAESAFRIAVEKEQSMEKFVQAHTRYLKAALAVLKSSDGLSAANREVSRLFLQLTNSADDPSRFLAWFQAAAAHESHIRLSGRPDSALEMAGSAKMMKFLK